MYFVLWLGVHFSTLTTISRDPRQLGYISFACRLIYALDVRNTLNKDNEEKNKEPFRLSVIILMRHARLILNRWFRAQLRVFVCMARVVVVAVMCRAFCRSSKLIIELNKEPIEEHKSTPQPCKSLISIFFFFIFQNARGSSIDNNNLRVLCIYTYNPNRVCV